MVLKLKAFKCLYSFSHLIFSPFYSQHTDRLREELHFLRGQLAQINRLYAHPDRGRQPSIQSERGTIHGSPKNRPFDDLKHKLDDLRNQLQRTINTPQQTSTPYHPRPAKRETVMPNRDYEDLKSKIDSLAHELQKSRELRRPAFESSSDGSPVKSPQQTFLPVCPICSGVGYHKHGDYTFPRDFLESGQPVHVIPPQVAHDSSPVYFTSTPVQQPVPVRSSTAAPQQTFTHEVSPQPQVGQMMNSPAYRYAFSVFIL